MKASKHLEKAAALYARFERELQPINERLSALMADGGDDAFIAMQAGDGLVVTWGGGMNSRVGESNIDELLSLTYEEAVEWLECRIL